jgi:hypothetical protein
MPQGLRLKKGDISLMEILTLSQAEYKSKNIDDKVWRYKLDIVSAKIVIRKNLKYNPSTKQWEQSGREAQIQFLIKSEPESYKDRSNIKIHTYPVTFLFKDFEKGMNSSFRSRVGSLKKPIFPKPKKHFIKDAKDKKQEEQYRKENEKITQKNKEIAKKNILNGVQLQFFYDSMFIWNAYGLLWGPNYAKLPPKITNPELIPFFSKHELFIILKVLEPMFKKLKGIQLNKPIKNTEKISKTEKNSPITEPETITTIPESSDDFGMG